VLFRSLPATADTNARVAVAKNTDSTSTGTRRRIRFIEGTSVSITVADDPANEEIDVTISAATQAASVSVGLLMALS
jgi:hypothetical protein